ncbi:uncharacterized protein LOC126893661 [Daktulosphaira vitifoliae]|uniref:uncharacterized protein LOC126893661 n=1 Tax=Daktulosphaira vitifoliae TaxID=58002 RepID=UPI0021A9B59C|nr:uncharacterized protein LOC126893661 [Daktulosphaira vitifoliae]
MFPTPSGVRQGSHLGPLFFNIFINGIFSVVSPCRILLFDDDAKIFFKISKSDDCLTLQKVLDQFVIWCKTVGLSHNVDKCKVMSFYQTREMISHNYCLDRIQLKRVSQVNDLGIVFVPSLDSRPHIDFIVGKALRVLGFIRRNFSNFKSCNCLVALYSSLVRSTLQYGTLIWSPYTAVDKRRITKVQNRFLGFAGYTLNIAHPVHDYGPINEFLNLESLEYRRVKFGKYFIDRLLNGDIDALRLLEQLDILVPFNTRFQCQFYLPLSSSNFAKNAPLIKLMREYNDNL